MGCVLAFLALLAPRFLIVVLALFTNTLHHAFENALWPILGFFFAPYATLTYAWAMNSAGGVKGAFWIAVMVVAVLIDLGSLRAGNRARQHGWS